MQFTAINIAKAVEMRRNVHVCEQILGPVRVVSSDGKQRANLSVSQEVRAMLDYTRHPGQSYDGIIRELLAYWHSRGKTRRRDDGHVMPPEENPTTEIDEKRYVRS